MEQLIKPTRRGLITGLACLVAAPAIVRASSLMPVKVLAPTIPVFEYDTLQLWYVIIDNHISNPLDASEGLPPAYKVKEIMRKEDAIEKYGDERLVVKDITFNGGFAYPEPDFKTMAIKPKFVIEKPYPRMEQLNAGNETGLAIKAV